MENTPRAPSTRAALALRSPETGTTYTLNGEMLVGREVECDIQLKSIQVSRYHAKLIVAANGLFVEDLESSNGTFVNGKAINKRTEIGLGDQVAFDDVVFRVTSLHSGNAEPTALASSKRPGAAKKPQVKGEEALLTQRRSDHDSHRMTVVAKVPSNALNRFEVKPEASKQPDERLLREQIERHRQQARVSGDTRNKWLIALLILGGGAIALLLFFEKFAK